LQPEKEFIMPKNAPPTRTLRDRPDLDQLKRQSKELLDAFRAGHPDAAKEVHAYYRRADASTFALHDAQLVLARAHGFDSWPKLKAFVEGVTVGRLVDAVRRGDLDTVRSMLTARPELVHFDVAENDEHRALHHAVLQRQPEIVRFLMQHGADARKGIYPHRVATTAFTLAVERGYDEIVGIIEEEEDRRNRRGAAFLTAEGSAKAEAAPGARNGGAPPLPVNRVRAVSDAVAANRPDVLKQLLEQGLDPDEAGRLEDVEEVVPTWGAPLRACAMSGNVKLAQILLKHGANANTGVYAASSALYEAYKRRDEAMIALLGQHGGRLTAIAVAELGLVPQAAQLLAEAADGRTPDGIAAPRSSVAQELLWGAIDRPSLEIIALALPVIDWPRDDERWAGILQNGLYRRPTSDAARQIDAFRTVLERCDPDVRGTRETTLLHHIAASRGRLSAADRFALTTLLLDRDARLDIRDTLLRSTPLGWACRWGRIEMVRLLLERGADPIEADAERWATPRAWAAKMGHDEIARLLDTA
jgi:ankyrin repeat protein